MIHVIIIGLLFLLPSVNEGVVEDWALKKDKDGIQIFTRKVEGSRIFEYKAVTTIETDDLEKLVEIVFDAKEYPTWIEHVVQGEVLNHISDNEKMVYSVAKLPFPFKNRDVVTSMTLDKGPEYRQINIEGKPDYIDTKSKIIRVPQAKGFWRFERESKGTIVVHYQFLSDPGGQIPAWVINAFIVDGPYKTLINLKQKFQ